MKVGDLNKSALDDNDDEEEHPGYYSYDDESGDILGCDYDTKNYKS